MQDANGGVLVETQTESESRLVPLPHRVFDDEIVADQVRTPTQVVAELLERTAHLLSTLDTDVAGLRADQESERERIERETQRRRDQADAAVARLKELEYRARQLAMKKAREEDLDSGLTGTVKIDDSKTFDDLVEQIEEEVRLAKGITGAIRLPRIGALLHEASYRVDLMLKEADKVQHEKIDATEDELHAERKEARASYEIGMSIVERDLAALESHLASSAMAWTDKRWRDWTPPESVGHSIRAGTVHRADLPEMHFPWIIECPSENGWAIELRRHRTDAIDGVRSIIARVLTAIPPGGVSFTFVDPKGLGESVAAYLQLGQYDPRLIDTMVYTLGDEIEAKLTELTHHIESVIKQHLQGRYHTLDEFHDAVGEVVEPYRVLVVFDFPTQFSDQARQLLRGIIENGPKCGVHTILVVDSDLPKSMASKVNALLSTMNTVRADDHGYYVRSPNAGQWRLELDAPPGDGTSDGDLIQRIVTLTGEGARKNATAEVTPARLFALAAEAARMHSRDDVPDLDIAIDPEDLSTWWHGTAAKGIGVPLGRTSGREIASLWLNGAEACALIGGRADAGVPDLLHDVVTSLVLTYPPDQLELFLVDLVGVSELGVFAKHQLPHARLVAADAEREFGVSVLEKLAKEVDQRNSLFRSVGVERRGVEGYSELTGTSLRRIVLVLDGADQLFFLQDDLADMATQHLQTICRHGALCGVHAILSTQAPEALATMARDLLDQIGVRIALACSDAESEILLGTGNLEAAAITRLGEGVFTNTGGEAGGCSTFAAASYGSPTRDMLLDSVRAHAAEGGFDLKPDIFGGSDVALLDASPLSRLMTQPQMQQARLKPRLWLGEPVTLGDPVEVLLRRQDGANVLAVGQDEDLGQGMLLAMIVSVLLGHGRGVDVRVLDFMPVDDGFTAAVRSLGRAFPVHVARRRELAEVLTSVRTEVADRVERDDFRAPPLLLVLNGVGRARDFDVDDDVHARSEDFDALRTLEAIVREGPEVGVHTLAWCDQLESLQRRFSRATTREFAIRVAMRMKADASTALIGTTYASLLRETQALLFDEESNRLTKFRPYQMPSAQFIEGLAAAAVGILDAGAASA